MKTKSIISYLLLPFILLVGITVNTQAKAKINIVVNSHLGAPEMLIDFDTKQVVWQAEYDEFGEATILIEEVEFNHRFPGQYHDKESGLNYNYYRDYDPSLGRYVQSDPIGLAGGINTYGYVNGNPVNLTDPFGLCPMCAVLLPYVPAAMATGEAVLTGAAIYGAGVLGGEIGDSIVDSMAAPGNVGDTGIEGDYGDYVSSEKCAGRKPKDPCDWLSANKSKYSADRVKRQEKKWGCRRSRQNR